MRIEHICDMELAYREEVAYGTDFVLIRPYGGQEGTGYGEGDGKLSGPVLRGNARWVNHPHRRSDGIMMPDTHGVIMTEDGGMVMFNFRGRTVFEGGVGKQLLFVAFEAEDERYRWLNTSLCVLEGLIDSKTGKMSARIYTCVNELENAGSQASSEG